MIRRHAALAIPDAIGQQVVTCQPRDRDRYGRVVAVCSTRDRGDLNAWLVRQGWAIAYRQYSRDYVDEEAGAEAALVGIWIGLHERPEDYRRARRAPKIETGQH